jgi:hypothetical protein
MFSCKNKRLLNKRRIPDSWLKQGFWQGRYGKDAIKYKGLKEKGFFIDNGI